jgi:hypothetical protein
MKLVRQHARRSVITTPAGSGVYHKPIQKAQFWLAVSRRDTKDWSTIKTPHDSPSGVAISCVEESG